MKIAHQILVIFVEDIVLCLVGTWLGAIVPGQRLSGTANKISVAITLSSCILQYIIVLHKSCMYFKSLVNVPSQRWNILVFGCLFYCLRVH